MCYIFFNFYENDLIYLDKGIFLKKIFKLLIVTTIIIFAIFILLKNLVFDKEVGEVNTQSKQEYSCISTEYLGKYISEKYPNSKALVFYDSVSTSKLMLQRICGLRKGLAGKVEVVQEIGMPKKYPKGIPPQMFRTNEYIRAEDFNRAMKKYPRANMLISLVGLPADIEEMTVWQIKNKNKRPKVAVYGGDPKKLSTAIREGYIQALVVYREMDKSFNKLPPGDLEAAFNKRFMLITPQNINK